MKKAVLISLSVVLAGCGPMPIVEGKKMQASSSSEWGDAEYEEEIRRQIKWGNWQRAFLIVENWYLFGGRTSSAFPLLKEFPLLLENGATAHFTANCVGQNGLLKQKRLNSLIAMEAAGIDVSKPRNIVSHCEDVKSQEQVVASAPTAAKEEAPHPKKESKYPNSKLVPTVTKAPDKKRPVYGKVFDVQIRNLSTAGNSAGSALGATVAEAAYIDNSSWNNYSATKQIGVGLLGAFLGASMNKQAVSRFEITYYVKTEKGELVKSSRTRKAPDHYPVNSCVRVDTINNFLYLANFSNCEGF